MLSFICIFMKCICQRLMTVVFYVLLVFYYCFCLPILVVSSYLLKCLCFIYSFCCVSHVIFYFFILLVVLILFNISHLSFRRIFLYFVGFFYLLTDSHVKIFELFVVFAEKLSVFPTEGRSGTVYWFIAKSQRFLRTNGLLQ